MSKATVAATPPGRLLLVAPGYPPQLGGVEYLTAQLATALSQSGWAVEVATQDSEARAVRTDDVGGILVRRFPMGFKHPAYGWSPALARWLRDNGAEFEIVHCHSYHSTPALLAARAPSRRLVFSPFFHGIGHSLRSRVIGRAYKLAARRIFDEAGAVICVSKAEARLVTRYFPVAERKIRVIPCGVTAPPAGPQDDAAAILSEFDAEQLVLCSGRLERYKGVDRLIEATRFLDEGVVTVVTGHGPEDQALHDLVSDRRLDDRVRLLGTVSRARLASLQRVAHTYVTLSTRESFNMAAYEAAAAGARVVASAIPVHQEMAEVLLPGTVSLVSEDAPPERVAAAIQGSLAEGRIAGPQPVKSWLEVAAQTAAVYGSSGR